MNPYCHIPMSGDARTWHTPIMEKTLQDALAAGVDYETASRMIKASGSDLQLDIITALHPDGPREERMGKNWVVSRHRYHDHAEQTQHQQAQTAKQIKRWVFNEKRSAALGDGNCNAPEHRWSIHCHVITRIYREWRGMDVQGFLYNTDETETFTVQSSGDRIQRFACTIGEARIDATWGKTQVEVPISVPHTLDATIIGQPLVKIIEHQVFDHDDLVVQELIRRPGRTRIMLERAWTTIGALP